jgi:DNA processing protein
MIPDLYYQLALSFIPGIGPIQARNLLDHFGNARAIFLAPASRLKNINGIGETKAEHIKSFNGFAEIDNEIRFIEQNNIKPLFINDPGYPKRLLNCSDAPLMLFFKGSVDLNASRIVAIVGTRNYTDYGRLLTEKFVGELSCHDIIIVSGLAYGIDVIAHQAALHHQMQTIAVLAHGLGTIYPPTHSQLASKMIEHGGLLTEFHSSTNPDRHNFPTRNRIVAGMSDATIVIETGIKGGSMITAELANGYNKDVFAFPGRINDSRSAGCNRLIFENKACLLTCAGDLVDMMGWGSPRDKQINRQRQIFIELSQEEKMVIEILGQRELMHIDEINLGCTLSNSTIASAILNLELLGLVRSLPGKMYGLL